MTQGADEHEPRKHSGDVGAMFGSSADYGIIKLDAAGDVVQWSPGAQAILGYSDAEVLGKNVGLFHSEEDRANQSVERELGAALESGGAQFESWRVRKDGTRFLAGVAITPILDTTGAVVGFAKIVRDLAAEQKRANDMFQAVLEAAPDAIVIADRDGRITLANAQTDRIFGYPRADLIGKEVEILVPPRLRTNHVRLRTGFFASPSPRRMGVGLELMGLHRDGREIPIEVSLSPVQVDQQVFVSVAIRDVTERRENEKRLRRQHEEIMELSTPVIQVWEKVLCLPLIGTLDSMRAARLTEGLLTKIGETQAEVVIFDISGVPTIDTQVAQHLLRTVQAAALMGTRSIMCGVRPETAQAMVHLGIDVGQLLSRGTLQDALQLALTLLSERAETVRDARETLRQISTR